MLPQDGLRLTGVYFDVARRSSIWLLLGCRLVSGCIYIARDSFKSFGSCAGGALMLFWSRSEVVLMLLQVALRLLLGCFEAALKWL